jgi:hypothetical protein
MRDLFMRGNEDDRLVFEGGVWAKLGHAIGTDESRELVHADETTAWDDKQR